MWYLYTTEKNSQNVPTAFHLLILSKEETKGALSDKFTFNLSCGAKSFL